MDEALVSSELASNGSSNFPLPIPGASYPLLLVSLAGVVLGVGIVANGVIIALLCTQQSARLRNSLQLNLCLADLFVCGISVPLSAAVAASDRVPWPPLAEPACRLALFLQTAPLYAATLSLAVLSLDRVAAIRRLRTLARLRQLFLAGVWGAAGIFAVPASAAATFQADRCQESAIPLSSLPLGLVLVQLIFVHALPAIVVTVCHGLVARNLCEVSLTAAARRGEVPLPLPILRHPRHVIIVASVANDGPSKVHGQVIPFRLGDRPEDESSEDSMRIRADLAELRAGTGHTRRNATRRRRHPRRFGQRGSGGAGTSGANANNNTAKRHLPRPQLAPSLIKCGNARSRRHLAAMLILQSILFVLCWAPYICAVIAIGFNSYMADYIRTAGDGLFLPLCLLLGQAHSALNPAMYWAQNRQRLPWPGGGSWLTNWKLPIQLRPRAVPQAPPSSTNEAALGPFHPRFVTPRKPVERPINSLVM